MVVVMLVMVVNVGMRVRPVALHLGGMPLLQLHLWLCLVVQPKGVQPAPTRSSYCNSRHTPWPCCCLWAEWQELGQELVLGLGLGLRWAGCRQQQHSTLPKCNQPLLRFVMW